MGKRNGDPEWIRTTGLQIRNLMLYPTELRDRKTYTYPAWYMFFKPCRPWTWQ